MTRRLIDMVEALFETMGNGEGIILINDGIDRAHNNISACNFFVGFCLWDLGSDIVIDRASSHNNISAAAIFCYVVMSGEW